MQKYVIFFKWTEHFIFFFTFYLHKKILRLGFHPPKKNKYINSKLIFVAWVSCSLTNQFLNTVAEIHTFNLITAKAKFLGRVFDMLVTCLGTLGRFLMLMWSSGVRIMGLLFHGAAIFFSTISFNEKGGNYLLAVFLLLLRHCILHHIPHWSQKRKKKNQNCLQPRNNDAIGSRLPFSGFYNISM